MKYFRNILLQISLPPIDIFIVLLSGLAFIGISAAGLSLISIKPVASSSSSSPESSLPPSSALAKTTSPILFATVTPGPVPNLNENLQFRPLATPEAVSAPPVFEGANELGKIMVLEYHRIGYPETRYQRTPDNLRADLLLLHAAGYYPVNFIDLINGLPDVPAGKKPVVLTFDDSDISQFRMIDDNVIDADSAVGIILNFHSQHPEEWPPRATFFVLGDDTGDYISVFGQSKWAKSKLQFLIKQGMEVGSHTVNHTDLSIATAERIHWELAISKHVIEEMAPGYTVQTLSVPYGGFPFTPEFLKTGEWGDYSYQYAGSAAAWGGPTVSPFDQTFDPYHVSRLEVTADSFDYWLNYFEQNPHEYYISDGNPAVVTIPEREIAAE